MRKGQRMPLKLKKQMIKTLTKIPSLRAKPFYQIDEEGNIVTKWNSLGEIKRVVGYRPYHVQRVLHKQLKTFKKYKWVYTKEYNKSIEMV